jgi:hypothetical protein
MQDGGSKVRKLDPRSARATRGAIALAALATAAWSAPGAQSADSLPFAVGEELRFQLSVAKFGKVGRGTMTVEGPQDVRGQRTLLLRFAVRGRVGLVPVESTTESWVDPTQLASLRFAKHERQFFRSRRERVEIFPDDRRWSSRGESEAVDGDSAADGRTNGGETGQTPTDSPLDELSFIYFLRTLPLDEGAIYSLSRHFQAERNPVVVTVIRREAIATPAGAFATILVEMRVRDSRHYEREGVIRLNLSDDRWRIPVRIETSMPVVGKTVLLLNGRRAASGEVARR